VRAQVQVRVQVRVQAQAQMQAQPQVPQARRHPVVAARSTSCRTWHSERSARSVSVLKD